MMKQILIQIIVYLTIFSGFILCSLNKGRFSGETLPLTCIGVVCILYVFGLFGLLKYGVFAVLLLSICTYTAFTFHLIRDGFSAVKQKFPLKESVLFTLLFFLATLCNSGRMLLYWDEFSHWGLVVKQMSMIDALGTDISATSVYFKSYPPGIALFQYYIEKISLIVAPERGFCEWRLFFAYQLFALSFLFPFISRLDFKKISSYINLFVMVSLPLTFFGSFYKEIYVDAFLSIVFGSFIAYILLDSIRPTKLLYVLSGIFFLCLIKTSGVLLAAFVVFAYVLKERKKIGYLIAVLLLTFGSWRLNVGLNNVHSNSPFLSALSRWKEVTGVFFKELIFGKRIYYSGANIPYFYILLFFVAVLVFLYKTGRRNSPYEIVLPLAFLGVYILGVLLAYIFVFSEDEALALASFNRYNNTAFFAVFIYIILYSYMILCGKKCSDMLYSTILLLFILPFNVFGDLNEHFTKESVWYSNSVRPLYDVLPQKIADKTAPNSRIYFVEQNSDGFSYWVCRYDIMPRTLQSYDEKWYLTNGWTDGEISRDVSPSQWKKELAEGYDYVVLYTVDDTFSSEYGYLFTEDSAIENNRIYKVLPNGMLELTE